MKMVSLKRTPSELKDMKAEVSTAPADYYPQSLYLGKEEVDKLGLKGCKVGEEYMLEAKVRVSSMSTSSNDRGDDYSSVTLELREAAIEEPGEDDKKTEGRAKRMYSGASET